MILLKYTQRNSIMLSCIEKILLSNVKMKALGDMA